MLRRIFAQAAENLHTLLDAQNSWIYVIDPDKYELLYINAKTSKNRTGGKGLA